jgi:hypothetical protein
METITDQFPRFSEIIAPTIPKNNEGIFLKKCSICEIEKPLEEFRSNGTKGAWCIIC